MRRPKIYLDTTIPNYVFNDHVPDKQEAAKKLFTSIKAGKFEAYISTAVTREINNTTDQILKDKLISVIKDMEILEISSECIDLANEYIKREVIAQKNTDDALHIACASVYEMDFLISYNFEHIVRIKTIDNIAAINVLLGYRMPRIIIPEEVIDV